jgi:outer membrane protein OmpA-like peptidoglycan-associated protein
VTLLFAKGTSRLVDGQDASRDRLMASLVELDALARAAGERLAIDIVGHTDADGVEAANVPLSLARAEAIRALIVARTFTHLDFRAAGVGSREPAVRGGTEAEYERNRRVTLRPSRPASGR